MAATRRAPPTASFAGRSGQNTEPASIGSFRAHFQQLVADADTYFGVELPSMQEWLFTREDARRITQPVFACLGPRAPGFGPAGTRFGSGCAARPSDVVLQRLFFYLCSAMNRGVSFAAHRFGTPGAISDGGVLSIDEGPRSSAHPSAPPGLLSDQMEDAMSQRSHIDRMRVVLTCSVLVLLLSFPGRANADPVIDWNATALSSAFAGGLDNLMFGCNDALHESRMMAMVHVAIHDALNAIDRRYQPYAFDGHAPGASPDAAVAAAAHDVLVATYPRMPGEIGLTPDAAISLVEAAYTTALAAIPNGSAKSEGVLIGRAAAAAIVALRAQDNAELPFIVDTYVPGPNPGDFQFIPGFGPVVAAPVLGPGHAVRAPVQFAISAEGALRGQQQEVRGGFQRGEESRRRKQHHSDPGPNGDRHVLG